jgi:hypothetical protein
VTTPIGYPTAGEFGGALTADVTFPAQKPDYTTVPASPGGFAILHDLPGKPIAEYSASLDRTGVQNMRGLIEDCLAEYAAQGNPSALGAGDYMIAGAPLRYVTNAHLIMSSRCTLWGADSASSIIAPPVGTTASDSTTWPSNILIRGGILRRYGTLLDDENGTGFIPAGGAVPGHTCFIIAKNVLIDRLQVLGYYSRGIIIAGQDVRVLYPYFRYPQRRRDTGVVGSAAGGIRIVLGDNIWVYGADVDCGDDGFQFVTAYNSTAVTTNSGFIGGRVRSDGNAGLAVKLFGQAGAYTRDILFANIKAWGDGEVATVTSAADGFVDNIVFDNTDLTDLRSGSPLHGNGEAIFVAGKSGGVDAQGVGTVRLRSVRVASNTNGALRALGQIGKLEINGGTLAGAVSGTDPTVLVLGATELAMRDVEVEAGGGTGVAIGGRARSRAVTTYDDDAGEITITYTTPGQVGKAVLDGVTVTNLAAGQRAVVISNSPAGVVRDLRLVAADAGGAADGLLLGRNATNYRVEDVDARGITGQPVVDQGRLNTVGRIIGAAATSEAVEMIGPRRLNVNATIARSHTATTALAWAYDASGDLTTVGQNAARWTSARHLMVGDARTVTNTNPVGANGVAGTLTGGSPTGTLPTGWSLSAQTGTDVEFIGYEAFGGVSLPVFRFSGTGNGVSNVLNFTPSLTASSGQTWTVTTYSALLDGDKAGLEVALTRASVIGGTGTATSDMIAALSEELEPTTITTTTGTSTTAVRGRLDIRGFDGEAFDVTIALACFIEQASWHATPTQPATTGSVTRGRDIVTQPLSSDGANAGYVSGAVLLPRAPVGYDAGIFALDNGTDGNRLSLVVPDGTTDVTLASVSGGVQQFSEVIGSVTIGDTLRFAVAYDRSGGSARAVISGMTAVETVTGTMPSSGFTQIGAGRATNTGTGATLNGEVIGLSFGDDGEISNNTLLSLVAG